VARAPRSRKAGGGRPKRQVQLPAKYTKDFPVHEGHQFSVRGIPYEVWERAKRRAHAEDHSVRVIVIRALDLFGKGRLNL
jgi:hypothetical protein